MIAGVDVAARADADTLIERWKEHACPHCGKKDPYGSPPRAPNAIKCGKCGAVLEDLTPNTGGRQNGHVSAPVASTLQYRAPITADALMRMTFPEPKYVIPGILPEGSAVLAGPPKIGKSWLVLAWCVAVASGGRALGKIEIPEAGDVLYLALEDTKRRLYTRLDKIMAGDDWPPRLSFYTDAECPRMDQGGGDLIEQWLVLHPDARLVVVDTLARIRGARTRNGNGYEEDYAAITGLKSIADRYGVALLIVHHVRKMAADDPLDTISGTNGISGAVDTITILRRERGRADASLFVTGRDVEEQDLALKWDQDLAMWSLIGEAAEYRMSKDRADVIAAIKGTGRPLGPKEVAELLGKKPTNTKALMWKMLQAGELKNADYGKYTTVDAQESNQSHQSNHGNQSQQGNQLIEEPIGRVGTGPCPTCDQVDCICAGFFGSGRSA